MVTSEILREAMPEGQDLNFTTPLMYRGEWKE